MIHTGDAIPPYDSAPRQPRRAPRAPPESPPTPTTQVLKEDASPGRLGQRRPSVLDSSALPDETDHSHSQAPQWTLKKPPSLMRLRTKEEELASRLRRSPSAAKAQPSTEELLDGQNHERQPPRSVSFEEESTMRERPLPVAPGPTRERGQPPENALLMQGMSQSQFGDVGSSLYASRPLPDPNSHLEQVSMDLDGAQIGPYERMPEPLNAIPEEPSSISQISALNGVSPANQSRRMDTMQRIEESDLLVYNDTGTFTRKSGRAEESEPSVEYATAQPGSTASSSPPPASSPPVPSKKSPMRAIRSRELASSRSNEFPINDSSSTITGPTSIHNSDSAIVNDTNTPSSNNENFPPRNKPSVSTQDKHTNSLQSPAGDSDRAMSPFSDDSRSRANSSALRHSRLSAHFRDSVVSETDYSRANIPDSSNLETPIHIMKGSLPSGQLSPHNILTALPHLNHSQAMHLLSTSIFNKAQGANASITSWHRILNLSSSAAKRSSVVALPSNVVSDRQNYFEDQIIKEMESNEQGKDAFDVQQLIEAYLKENPEEQDAADGVGMDDVLDDYEALDEEEKEFRKNLGIDAKAMFSSTRRSAKKGRGIDKRKSAIGGGSHSLFAERKSIHFYTLICEQHMRDLRREWQAKVETFTKTTGGNPHTKYVKVNALTLGAALFVSLQSTRLLMSSTRTSMIIPELQKVKEYFAEMMMILKDIEGTCNEIEAANPDPEGLPEDQKRWSKQPNPPLARANSKRRSRAEVKQEAVDLSKFNIELLQVQFTTWQSQVTKYVETVEEGLLAELRSHVTAAVETGKLRQQTVLPRLAPSKKSPEPGSENIAPNAARRPSEASMHGDEFLKSEEMECEDEDEMSYLIRLLAKCHRFISRYSQAAVRVSLPNPMPHGNQPINSDATGKVTDKRGPISATYAQNLLEFTQAMSTGSLMCDLFNEWVIDRYYKAQEAELASILETSYDKGLRRTGIQNKWQKISNVADEAKSAYSAIDNWRKFVNACWMTLYMDWSDKKVSIVGLDAIDAALMTASGEQQIQYAVVIFVARVSQLLKTDPPIIRQTEVERLFRFHTHAVYTPGLGLKDKSARGDGAIPPSRDQSLTSASSALDGAGGFLRANASMRPRYMMWTSINTRDSIMRCTCRRVDMDSVKGHAAVSAHRQENKFVASARSAAVAQAADPNRKRRVLVQKLPLPFKHLHLDVPTDNSDMSNGDIPKGGILAFQRLKSVISTLSRAHHPNATKISTFWPETQPIAIQHNPNVVPHFPAQSYAESDHLYMELPLSTNVNTIRSFLVTFHSFKTRQAPQTPEDPKGEGKTADLKSCIRTNLVVLKIFKDILAGLAYLHDQHHLAHGGIGFDDGVVIMQPPDNERLLPHTVLLSPVLMPNDPLTGLTVESDGEFKMTNDMRSLGIVMNKVISTFWYSRGKPKKFKPANSDVNMKNLRIRSRHGSAQSDGSSSVSFTLNDTTAQDAKADVMDALNQEMSRQENGKGRDHERAHDTISRLLNDWTRMDHASNSETENHQVESNESESSRSGTIHFSGLMNAVQGILVRESRPASTVMSGSNSEATLNNMTESENQPQPNVHSNPDDDLVLTNEDEHTLWQVTETLKIIVNSMMDDNEDKRPDPGSVLMIL